MKSTNQAILTKDGNINIQSMLNAASVHREDNSSLAKSHVSNEKISPNILKSEIENGPLLDIDKSSQNHSDLKSMIKQQSSQFSSI
jgi:hypothetical protein